MRFRWIISILLCLALVAGAIFYLSIERLPVMRLENGNEVRVLGVSYGTNHNFSPDPVWKVYAERVLPESWAAKLNVTSYRQTSPFDSLVVWVGEFDTNNKPANRISLGNAVAIFAEGQSAQAKYMPTRTNLLCLQYSIYPRTEEHLKFRFTNPAAEFEIRNPSRVKPTKWIDRGIPQTNFLPGTSVIFESVWPRSGRLIPFRFRIASTNESSPGWTTWRAEVLDSIGNWATFDNERASTFRDFRIPFERGTVKVLASATEYISAGMHALPSDGMIQELAAKPRAYNLGLEKVFLLGAGKYRLTNGAPVPIRGEPADVSGTTTRIGSTLLGSEWILEPNSARPSLLVIQNQYPGGPILRARLRERIGLSRDGKVFQTRYPTTVVRPGNPSQAAHLFPVTILTDQTEVEAEVIAVHPPTEFFIDAGLLSGNPAAQSSGSR